MIEVEALRYAYEGQPETLKGVSFALASGEKAVLLGANGTGKTTLLKILNGLLFARRGSYRYRGEEVDERALGDRAWARRFRSAVVLLFQNPSAMLFNPTVYDEIAFGLRQLGLEDERARVQHWAQALGIAPLLERPPFHLSGGEKQKVCLAALLAIEPEVLLLDEPTANLDPRSTGWLVDFLQDLPLTTVVTTHNLSLAGELGSRCLVLAEGDGIAYDGAIEPLLSDREALLAANLVHRHRHRHGGVEHRHFHLHDWD